MHRGRIQAQGDGLNESEAWSQPTPISYALGCDKKTALKKKLPSKELLVRTDAFSKAKKFIQNSQAAGGVSAQVSKTYMVKGESEKRVDIEVRAGVAFI